MSMHKQPLTTEEIEGLRAHGLSAESPSQLSDDFRQGMAWSRQGLARIRAEAQADALELFASGMREVNDEGATADLYGMARLLDTRADQLRRQAEGEES